MTKDEILQAFHLIAMGRARHPLQEQLAEELARVFAMKASVPAVEMTAPAPTTLEQHRAAVEKSQTIALAPVSAPALPRKAKGK